ncbi:hypothetical protein [Burkholderia glumae]|uniref:hypothetical protein n=1 Tax=Burkholderia glumae TaxID=337 RepID=UPI001F529CF1|nr:hypothetical protein [Burkholderia glumae]MCM2490655.1 hypothetical protein [Burkholderia glumae]MCM2544712.1 hypothetical protein [Burkholderia glumae]
MSLDDSPRRGPGKRKLVTIGLICLAAAASRGAMAAQDRPPVVLDTQTGIHDGRSGVVLQTAPLDPAPIVAPAEIRQPAGLQQNNQIPMVVAPYIRVPAPSYRQ